ncbi:hypothetical protein NG798_06360 [Ancylothrix sp. C2]|uniref:hypothetical protein n=1 Tax=Ancylothrix sp. D3o TaxID=2953691 RepID=UPI0021BBACAE|nr:hypothetical protein [Ancylothrix sp. D3o]MCT7949402.1 hypothetical protein [Ancylothrix sp. D3o]
MQIIEILLFLSTGAFVTLGIVNSLKAGQQQQQLQTTFYRLLETQNSNISLIQLAAAAKVDAQIARQYLENQAKVFNASLEVDEDGNTYYCFPKL